MIICAIASLTSGGISMRASTCAGPCGGGVSLAHLRRTLRRWRIARPLLLDLAPPDAAVVAAALFDIADMLRRFAGQGHDIPAQDGVLGSGEFQRREHVGAKRRLRLGHDNRGVKQRL